MVWVENLPTKSGKIRFFIKAKYVALIAQHIREERRQQDKVKRYFDGVQQKLEEERRSKLDEVNP